MTTDIKPITAADLMDAAIHGEPIDPLRALAAYADPSNWVQCYGGEDSDGNKLKPCEWAFIGPTRPGYELAQHTLSSVTCGGPPIDWKKRHDDLLKHVTALGSAASILRDNHKSTSHCEMPRTCGGCHFWTGVIEACRDLENGDKATIRKALAIVNSSQNNPEHKQN